MAHVKDSIEAFIERFIEAFILRRLLMTCVNKISKILTLKLTEQDWHCRNVLYHF